MLNKFSRTCNPKTMEQVEKLKEIESLKHIKLLKHITYKRLIENQLTQTKGE